MPPVPTPNNTTPNVLHPLPPHLGPQRVHHQAGGGQALQVLGRHLEPVVGGPPDEDLEIVQHRRLQLGLHGRKPPSQRAHLVEQEETRKPNAGVVIIEMRWAELRTYHP